MPMPRIRPMSVRVTVAAALLVVGATGLAPQTIAQQNNPGAGAIRYRQSIYNIVYNNFGPLGGMAAGKVPYDAKRAATAAERVAFMATIAPEAFPDVSKSGAPTKAKPEIWTNRADFDQLMKNFGEKTAALAAAAKGGSLDTLKPAVAEAQKACKACHDKYKLD